MKITKEQRELQNSELKKKFILTLGIIAFCILAYLLVIGPYLAVRDEGLTYFLFTEVPASETINHSIIHLEDKNIMNIKGLGVKFENGKLSTIKFGVSGNVPALYPNDFNDMYGTPFGADPASRKYLEYNGVYYYGTLVTP